jgi:hypothetical protein
MGDAFGEAGDGPVVLRAGRRPKEPEVVRFTKWTLTLFWFGGTEIEWPLELRPGGPGPSPGGR